MIKKTIFVVVLAAFLTIVYADENAKNIPMAEIEDCLKTKTDITTMEKCSNRNLMQFFHLDYEQYDEHLYYKNKEALSVEELLIVKSKDREDLATVKDAVDERIESQIKTYDSYGPAQAAMLKNAIVSTKGNYLFYCTGEDADHYEEVFKRVI